MKDRYLRMLEAGLDDEVDINAEWRRLARRINNDAEPRKSIKIPRFLKYTAAVLVGVFITSATMLWKNEESGQAITGSYTLKTDIGEKSVVELPDGTKIWLNACTTIEYAPGYGIVDRNILLDGEAYFEVASGQALPFIVKAGGIHVKALGTAFNVSAYPDDHHLTTTLLSGNVAVRPELTQQEMVLEPNQMAVYYKDRHRIEKKACYNNPGLQWRKGLLSFDMISLEEITRLLQRNYDVDFIYENPGIKKLKFSGSFRSNEPIDDILEVIATNTSVGYKMNKNTVVFR